MFSLSRLLASKATRRRTRFLLHVGYPRTSTSWLQSDIFPNLKGVHYLGYRYEKSHWYQQNLSTEIALSEDKDYHPAKLRRVFDRLMRWGVANVFSSEAILSPYDGTRTARRTAEVFADYDTHILIGLRRQDHLAFSVYFHQLPHFHAIFAGRRSGKDPVYSIEECLKSPVRGCKWPDCELSHCVRWQPFKSSRHCDCLDLGFKTLPLWYFDFHKVVQDFRQAFSPERVHLLLLEETAKDSLASIRRVAGLLNSPSSQEDLRKLADIPKRNSLQPVEGLDSEGLKRNYYAEGGTGQWVLEQCRPSNRKLAELYPDENFQEHGYL